MQAVPMPSSFAVDGRAHGGPLSRLRWLLLGLALLLAACGARVELFSAANESEANEVLSVLLDAGIAAQKATTKTGVAVSVDGQQVARALDILRSRGLPRERFDGMGQIFRKEGLVSSPLEERARYIYALSQELTNTLSQMDGVLAARVHVVLPERGGVGENTTPSTAAVFIKHQTGYNLDALQPQIRKLVTHAIPGLTEDRVSIALVSAQPAAAASAVAGGSRHVLGIEVGEGSSATLIAWMTVLVLLVLCLAGALGYLLWRHGMPGRVRPERREPVTEAR
ncbi:type III secretion system inner membrane ring lipoprotein SctJ [Achromobacter xylosoxidans]|uniref:type III secretion system inner membrane ring lipoprotein SctJ n=1 Tax=Alcaligenes xylosoxydans xylosoxydans TaxID=85698 RepID=UPI001EED0E94|nr:type III secretion inner membrane ring lipoprotein SctJ [Achromobacter xylosoxidans]WPQ33750.1 type III secretion inner membrane ring lipoprotein SctJ [Achromobacter xylosoxidans]